jgi:mono/diheme cytochrome c family protein
MKFLRALFFILLLALLGAAAFVYSGAFDVAADVPHSSLVYQLLDTARQRSIATRASGIAVPPLDDPQRIATGAEHYPEMCAGCHLAPGMRESELRNGLYPAPPDFTQRNNLDPAQMFWAIKHGIKLTAMPAWGKSHDDAAIWGLVAFVKKLPELTPQQYEQATSTTGAHHHHEHADDHSGDAQSDHEHGDHDPSS